MRDVGTVAGIARVVEDVEVGVAEMDAHAEEEVKEQEQGDSQKEGV